jgi:hypothetical protein
MADTSLPAQILSIPDNAPSACESDPWWRGYRLGHRNARNAAVALARAALAAQPAPDAKPVTLADVLDALNLFNRPKPSEDDGPWEGGHFIRVDYLPDFINIIAAAWFGAAPIAQRCTSCDDTGHVTTPTGEWHGRCNCDAGKNAPPLFDPIAQQAAPAQARPHSADEHPYTYASTQATKCAGCGEYKHTPLRIDAMGGYVCLTCIDGKLGRMLGEFGYPAPQEPLHVTHLIDWLAARYRAAGGKGGITDVSAWAEEVMRWTEEQHGITVASTADER